MHSDSPFHKIPISQTTHFTNSPFPKLPISQNSPFHKRQEKSSSRLLASLDAVASTSADEVASRCTVTPHFTKSPFHKPPISQTPHFTNFPFHKTPHFTKDKKNPLRACSPLS